MAYHYGSDFIVVYTRVILRRDEQRKIAAYLKSSNRILAVFFRVEVQR